MSSYDDAPVKRGWNEYLLTYMLSEFVVEVDKVTNGLTMEEEPFATFSIHCILSFFLCHSPLFSLLLEHTDKEQVELSVFVHFLSACCPLET